ncbi:MAG: phosphate ABC transporter permease subunit PstC [Geminicoccaceae bacterium]|nr:phosphate ABC transporter permease subunit PstC [Geminicoccaceae bacterium]
MSLIAIVLVLALAGYVLGRRRAITVADGNPVSLHSRPGHYGWHVFLLGAGPAVALTTFWLIGDQVVLRRIVESRLPPAILDQPPEMLNFFIQDVARVALGGKAHGELTPVMQDAASYYGWLLSVSTWLRTIIVLLLAIFGIHLALRHVAADFRARNHVERWVRGALLAAAGISILTTAGIVFSVLFESVRFFDKVPVTDFLFGLSWSPQTALRADQVGSSGSFGAVPLFAGTLLITAIAMAVAGPIGMLSAMYLSEYASPTFRGFAKPALEILAGVPTVVYGFFAALTVAPFIRGLGESLGLSVSSESALAAGLVMGIMIIPFVSSLADDAISAVPRALRDASLGLGATRAETIVQVIMPAALPGIIAGFLLAISRAIGETMIVVMAAGLAANLTGNPLQAVTTVTVQMVTLLVGDQEFDSAKTLAAFALGLVLFLSTLLLNIIALRVMHTYREQYD